MAKDNAHGSESDFVRRIVSDPAHPPNVAFLCGYLGDSSQEGCVRLYCDVELSEYYEIPKDKLVHQQAVPDDHFGAQYVWVQRDAELVRKGPGQQDVAAKFLSGEIQRDFGAQPRTVPLGCCLPTQPLGDCTFFSCPPVPPSPGIACTVLPQWCPIPTSDCTLARGMPPSQVCTHFTPQWPICRPRTPFCPRVAALPTLHPHCTQVCHPPGGGGTPVMMAAALPTLYRFCTQQCHPGGGGGPVMMAAQAWPSWECTATCFCPSNALECIQAAPGAPEMQPMAAAAAPGLLPQVPPPLLPTPMRPCPTQVNCTHDPQCCVAHTWVQSALIQCPRTNNFIQCCQGHTVFPSSPVICVPTPNIVQCCQGHTLIHTSPVICHTTPFCPITPACPPSPFCPGTLACPLPGF